MIRELADLHISLKRNNITDRGVIVIAALLPYLKSIVKCSLNLDANKMSFEAQEILGRRLGHMRKLTDLFLDMENA